MQSTAPASPRPSPSQAQSRHAVQRDVRHRTQRGVRSTANATTAGPGGRREHRGAPSADILPDGAPQLATERGVHALTGLSAGARDGLAPICVRHCRGRRLQCRRRDAGGWSSATLGARSKRRRRGRDPRRQRVAASGAGCRRDAVHSPAARSRAAAAARAGGRGVEGIARTSRDAQRSDATFFGRRGRSRFSTADDGHRIGGRSAGINTGRAGDAAGSRTRRGIERRRFAARARRGAAPYRQRRVVRGSLPSARTGERLGSRLASRLAHPRRNPFTVSRAVLW